MSRRSRSPLTAAVAYSWTSVSSWTLSLIAGDLEAPAELLEAIEPGRLVDERSSPAARERETGQLAIDAARTRRRRLARELGRTASSSCP